jgi:hypothetical protein
VVGKLASLSICVHTELVIQAADSRNKQCQFLFSDESTHGYFHL